MTLTIYIKLSFPHPKDTTYKIWLFWVCSGVCSLSYSTQFSLVKYCRKRSGAGHTNLHCGRSCPIRIVTFMHMCSSNVPTPTLLRNLKQNSQLIGRVSVRNMMPHIVPGKSCHSNAQFSLQSIALLFSIILIRWLYVFLLKAGDIHPNPDPSSNTSGMHAMSATSSLLKFRLIKTSRHMSFVHYNVQSLAPKLDVLV